MHVEHNPWKTLRVIQHLEKIIRIEQATEEEKCIHCHNTTYDELRAQFFEPLKEKK